MAKIKVKILSPSKVVYEGEVGHVKLPTEDGVITVLPHHMGLFTVLRPGVIELVVDEGQYQVEEVFVFGGLARVDNASNSLLILADEAGMPSEELLKEVQEAIQAVKEKKAEPRLKVSVSSLVKAEKELRYLVFKRKE